MRNDAIFGKKTLELYYYFNNGEYRDGVRPWRMCAKRSEILHFISFPQQNLNAESASTQFQFPNKTHLPITRQDFYLMSRNCYQDKVEVLHSLKHAGARAFHSLRNICNRT